MMGKGEFAVFVAPACGGYKTTARSGGGKNDSPPAGGAKIAQLGAEKRQNRTIGVRLKKRMELNGIEPMTSRVRF